MILFYNGSLIYLIKSIISEIFCEEIAQIMKRSLPPLGPLPAFVTTAKYQSMTKAAQELNLTHGAISRAIQQLEHHFGFQLFERRNRRIYVTAKGAFLAEKIAGLLADLAENCEQAARLDDPQNLSISCEPSLAMRWLIPRLSGFYQRHPDIHIQLSTAGGAIDLGGQKTDLAIRRNDFLWPQDYYCTELATEFCGPVCHPDYWEKYQQQPEKLTFLQTRTRPNAWQEWQKSSQIKIARSSEKYFDHFYFSLQAAIAGLGIAIGPDLLVRDDLTKGHVIAPYGFVRTGYNYIGLSLRPVRQTESLSYFVNWLREACQSDSFKPTQ